MRRMDPTFEAAFSSEYPEEYNEALRSKRGKQSAIEPDAAIAVHVPIVPLFLTRFISGVVVMLLLIGAFFVISETNDTKALGLPSGQLLSKGGSSASGSNGSGLSTLSDSDAELADKIAPIGEAGSNMFQKLTD